jgi:hypothetical protein
MYGTSVINFVRSRKHNFATFLFRIIIYESMLCCRAFHWYEIPSFVVFRRNEKLVVTRAYFLRVWDFYFARTTFIIWRGKLGKMFWTSFCRYPLALLSRFPPLLLNWTLEYDVEARRTFYDNLKHACDKNLYVTEKIFLLCNSIIFLLVNEKWRKRIDPIQYISWHVIW